MAVIARWIMVGALGLGVQLTVLGLLVRLGLPTVLATTVAVGLTIVHNFLWHERWTWRHRPSRDARQRAARLGRFGVLTLLASLVGTVLLTTWLVDDLGVPLAVANVAAVVVVSVANFLSAHLLVFTDRARRVPVYGGPYPPWRAPSRIPPARLVVVVVAAAALTVPGQAPAAELTAETTAAWNRYVEAVEAATRADLASPAFLWPVDRAALRRGEIIVSERAVPALERGVPGGLVHHWRGTVFVAGVTLEQVLAELQSVDGRRHLQEDVLEWRMISGPPEAARIFLKLVRREIVTATYNTIHDVRYRRYTAARASSRSEAIRIAELADASTAREREKPVGEDRGFLWRLNSYWRYEQVPDGVILQVESITLSRQVPLLVRPLVGPIVSGIARESMERTLAAVRRRFLPVAGVGTGFSSCHEAQRCGAHGKN